MTRKIHTAKTRNDGMKSLVKKLNRRHKNSKFYYYLKNLFRQLIPNVIYRRKLQKKLDTLRNYDEAYIRKRVNYYNKLVKKKELHSFIQLSNFKLKKESKVYYFDSLEYTRYFDPGLKICVLFGDIIHVPEEPSLTKSRPIHGDNANSVILKLNKIRHFTFTNDTKPFEKKKDILVWRGRVARVHRVKFLEKHFNNPLCDIGQTNTSSKTDHWLKREMTIDEQLDYKFILCLEGNDVASNLKWVMSSGSIAVMPKPRYETWFMEGTLIPDHHYIELKEDYTDLDEKLNYYITHPNEARKIIKNANEYVDQFKNKKREDLISLLVLQKYFLRTGQVTVENPAFFN